MGVGRSTIKVEGVAALYLQNSTVNHYFDCNKTGSNHLIWEREGGPLMFPVESIVNINGIRMNMTGIDYPDTGIYTCRDTEGGASVSVNITGGRSVYLFACLSVCLLDFIHT